MRDFKTRISRDYEYDARHFQFVRNSGLPRHALRHSRTIRERLQLYADVILVVVSIGCVIVGLLVSR